LLNPPVNTNNNLLKVYTKGIAVKKKRIKKNQIVWWRVSFTDDFTNRINPTVKFICEYADEILSSVYTDDNIRGITVRFKKTNYFLKPFFLVIDGLIFQRVGIELHQMSLILLTHRQNKSVDIFKRVEKELLQISLQLLTYQWNYIRFVCRWYAKLYRGNYWWNETNNFFLHACSVYKAITKFINDRLTNRPEIVNKRFPSDVSRSWSRR
jgi:hypothetical protein